MPGTQVPETTPDGSLAAAQQAFSLLMTPKRGTKGTEEPPPEQRPSPDAEQVPPAADEGEDPDEDREAAAAESPDEGDEAATEHDEEQPEGEKPEPVRMVRVKLPDGEKELPEPEVAAGYLRQQDYTRKTMELAESKKKFEQEEIPQLRAERQRYAEVLTQLEQTLSAEPDWESLKATMSPDAWQSAWIARQQEKDQLAKVQQERHRVVQAELAIEAQKAQERLAEERTKLQAAIPEFADATKGPKLAKALTEFALAQGFTPEEAQITDHRLVRLLHKAYQYDQVSARKPVPTNQVTRTIRAASPGTGTERKSPTKRAQAEGRLQRSGSVDDAAAAFEAMMD